MEFGTAGDQARAGAATPSGVFPRRRASCSRVAGVFREAAMAWRRGQRAVCVFGGRWRWHDRVSLAARLRSFLAVYPEPRKDAAYTVVGIGRFGDDIEGLFLAGCDPRIAYRADLFRPAASGRTDISVFKKLLEPQAARAGDARRAR
jgi:hypothetical protein